MYYYHVCTGITLKMQPNWKSVFASFSTQILIVIPGYYTVYIHFNIKVEKIYNTKYKIPSFTLIHIEQQLQRLFLARVRVKFTRLLLQRSTNK